MRHHTLVIAGTLALAITPLGCGGSSQTTENSPPAAPPPPASSTATHTKVAQAPAGTATPGGTGPSAGGHNLGTPQPAGPFQVTLTTDPALPKVGTARLTAKVTKNGQPVTAASVSVALSMPTMSMTGPTVSLKPAGDHYEGTADLSMAADWEAKTTVKAGGATGTATHDFKVS